MINITHLIQKDNDSVILNDITLTVPQKTVFGIFCNEKAERIALVETLVGVKNACDGEILICGHNIATDREKAQLLIGYMPEKMPFYKDMTVVEYLSFITEAKQLPFAEAQKNIKNALSVTNLLAVKDVLISKLAPTGRSRLGIAQAIASNPPVLVFDNPSADLNKNETKEIFKLIKIASRSRSVIVTSDDPEIFSFCDRAAVLSLGQLELDTKDVIERRTK